MFIDYLKVIFILKKQIKVFKSTFASSVWLVNGGTIYL